MAKVIKQAVYKFNGIDLDRGAIVAICDNFEQAARYIEKHDGTHSTLAVTTIYVDAERMNITGNNVGAYLYGRS